MLKIAFNESCFSVLLEAFSRRERERETFSSSESFTFKDFYSRRWEGCLVLAKNKNKNILFDGS